MHPAEWQPPDPLWSAVMIFSNVGRFGLEVVGKEGGRVGGWVEGSVGRCRG